MAPDARRPAWRTWARRLLSALLLAGFAAQLAVVAAAHEPWFDEAQAWLLARDAGVVELFTRQLRYEGSPGLWHLLLLVPAKLGLPYAALPWIGGACALAGAALVAFRSPFPYWARAGLLCSYVLAYQYAVVARSYTLLPVLLFAAALAWPRRYERVWRLVVPLGLLANVSLHGTLIAGTVAAVHFAGVLRAWPRLDPVVRRRNLAAAVVLLAVAATVAATLWPPADLDNGDVTEWKLTAEALRGTPDFLVASLTGQAPAAWAAVGLAAVWFWARRTLVLWLLPTAVLVLLSSLKYHAPHHDGVPFLVFVFALWVSLQPGSCRLPPRFARWPRWGALAGLALVLAAQAQWWAATARHDLDQPYSGSRALAAHLEGVDEDAEVYVSHWPVVAAAPYFDHNPFDNYRGGDLPAYWTWSERSPLRGRWIDLYLDRPDVVVWVVKYDWQERLPHLEGYRRSATYRGELFAKDRVVDRETFVILERGGDSEPRRPPGFVDGRESGV
jgi:hypothetical protein